MLHYDVSYIICFIVGKAFSIQAVVYFQNRVLVQYTYMTTKGIRIETLITRSYGL